MEAEKLDDLTELRFRQLERLTSALLEGQQNTVQILAEHSRRFDRVENRLERVEELLTLALDDLAFIKEVLTPKQ